MGRRPGVVAWRAAWLADQRCGDSEPALEYPQMLMPCSSRSRRTRPGRRRRPAGQRRNGLPGVRPRPPAGRPGSVVPRSAAHRVEPRGRGRRFARRLEAPPRPLDIVGRAALHAHGGGPRRRGGPRAVAVCSRRGRLGAPAGSEREMSHAALTADHTPSYLLVGVPDSGRGPSVPKADALPGCATPRDRVRILLRTSTSRTRPADRPTSLPPPVRPHQQSSPILAHAPALGSRRRCSSMVELQPSKLAMRVRFPSPAQARNRRSEPVSGPT